MTEKKTTNQSEQGQAGLQEVSARWSVLEAAPVAMLVSNAADGKVLFANQRLGELIDIVPEDLIGRLAPDFFVDPDDRNDVLAGIRKHGTLRDFELMIKKADGTPFLALLNIELVTYEGKQALLSGLVDLSTRRQAEQDIRENRERFQGMVETINEWVWEVDTTGTYTYVSPRITDLLGYEPEEVLGKTPFHLMPPEEAERVGAAFGELISKQVPLENLENINQHKDGRLRVLETSGVPIYDADDNFIGYRGTDRDITERREAEKAVQSEQQRAQTILELITSPMIISRVSDGKVMYANQALADIANVELDTFIGGRTADYFLDPADRDKANSIVQQEGGIKDFETQLLRGDGTSYWALLSVRLIDYMGDMCGLSTFIDISELKQAQDAVVKSEERFRSLIESAHIGILIIDDNFRFTFANDALCEMLQREREELIGSDFRQVLDEESLELVADRYLRRQKGEELPPQYEFTIVRPDGEKRRVEISTTVSLDAEGKARTMAHLTDITEQRQAEIARLESEQRYRTLIANAPEAIVIFDAETGLFVEANPSAEQLYGLSHDELMKVGPAHLSPETQPDGQSSLETAGRYIHQALQGGTPVFEWMHIHSSGAEVFCEIRLARYPSEDRELVRGSVADISERMKLETQVQEAFEHRGYQVQVSTEISQEISRATDLSELFENVVTLTKERLGYYHTQLLRYDPAQNAVVLVNGYGEPGQKMAAERHRMPQGVGLIGSAAATGETVMRSDLAEDPDWQPNPILPDTRGEIAVPIKLGDEVLGVLDIQSNQVGALTDDDRLLLEGICGQVAIAIDQTRLRQEMDERIQEISTLYRTMSREGWQRFEETGDLPEGYVFDQNTLRPVSADDFSDESIAHIPMTLPGGEVIGALGIDNNPENPLSVGEREFLDQVSEQIALALENARLTEQTQEALSETEVLLNTSRAINEALSIEELLNGVVRIVPMIDFDSLSLFRVASWDDENNPRTFDLYSIAFEPDQNIFTTIFTDVPDLGIKSILQDIDPSSAELLYTEVNDPKSPIPETVRERLIEQGMQSAIALTLTAGERIVGFMALNSHKPLKQLPEREERILQDVLADQVSTYLENMRLMEQSERKAESEALVNIIGQRIQSTTSVEDALQVAVKELGAALGVKKTAVQLELPRKDGRKSKESR